MTLLQLFKKLQRKLIFIYIFLDLKAPLWELSLFLVFVKGS